MSRKFLKNAIGVISIVLIFCFMAVFLYVGDIHVKKYLAHPDRTVKKTIHKELDPMVIENLINDYRESKGLHRLIHDEDLCPAVQAKLDHMFKEQYWNHFPPGGESTFFTYSGFYEQLGENLALSYDDEQTIIDGWINSPKHNENMLKANYTHQCVKTDSGKMLDREHNLTVSWFIQYPQE